MVKEKNMPSGEALKKAMGFLEAAPYLYEKYKAMLEKQKLVNASPYRSILAQMKKFAEIAGAQHNVPSDKIWAGEKAPNGLEAIQHHLAGNAADELRSQVNSEQDNLAQHIAINEQGELRRAYLKNGTSLESETAKELDIMFNDWLSERGFINKNSVIYKYNEETQSYQPVEPGETRGLLNELQSGSFEQYMKAKGFNLETHTQKYPEEAPALAEKGVKERLGATKEVPEIPAKKETPEPSSPSASRTI